MELQLKPGKYVLAVSGGVDSMALLNMAATSQQSNVSFVVAHYEHGIRQDSVEDQTLVRTMAAHHNLPFYTESGALGAGASEAVARQARYEFLENVRLGQGATAIVTAHHLDDLLETAIINLLRGTKWQGIAALGSTQTLRRPLLRINKAFLVGYSQERGLKWREDSTNNDIRYKRNYIRHDVMKRFSPEQLIKFRELVMTIRLQAAELKQIGDTFLDDFVTEGVIDRELYRKLPHQVAREITAQWLRTNGVSFDSKGLDRIVAGLTKLETGKRVGVNKRAQFVVGKTGLALKLTER